MRKIIVLFLVVFSMIGFSICGAATWPSEISLGGVRIGMSYQDVVNMFGKPSVINERRDMQGNLWKRYIEYGNTVQICFDYKKGVLDGVTNVYVIGNNGWTLPSGIKVGSKLKDVFAQYGNGTIDGKGMYGDYWKFKSKDGHTVTVSVERYIPNVDDIKDTDVLTSIQLNFGPWENNFYSRESHK